MKIVTRWGVASFRWHDGLWVGSIRHWPAGPGFRKALTYVLRQPRQRRRHMFLSKPLRARLAREDRANGINPWPPSVME